MLVHQRFMEFDAERISAYLDGELGPTERIAVESLLAENPAARELLSELRQLQQGVRDLPQHVLPERFADEVIRAAERLMLLGPDEPASTTTAAATVEPPAPAPRAAVRNLWSSPAWFVAGAAAAVLLMLALGAFRKGGQPEVVEAPQNDAVLAESDAPANPRTIQPPPTTVAEAEPDVETPSTGNSNVPPELVPEAPETPDEAPRVADGDVPRRPAADEPTPNAPEARSARSVPNGSAPDGWAPYGWIVRADVDAMVIAESRFDVILTAKGIATANKVHRSTVEQGEMDVVYAEGTAAALNAVFMDMFGRPTEFHSLLMKASLGVFHDPELWSEVFDAAGAEPGGSRAVHFTPELIPGRPLAVDEMTVEALEELDDALPNHAAQPIDQQGTEPTVDNGLIRAVFILRPVASTVEPGTDDSQAPSP